MYPFNIKVFLLGISLFFSICISAQEFTIIERPSDLNGGTLAIGDLNGDGDDDYVIGRSTRRTFLGIRNELEEINYEILDEGLWLTSMVIYDFDGDGDNDIICSELSEDLMIMWRNDGAANFERVDLPYPDYDSIAFADLDEDGTDELILGHGNRLEIFSVSMTTPTSLAVLSDDPFVNSPEHIKIFDNNRDGLLDIVGVFNRDGVLAFHQTGNLSFAEESIFKESFNNNIFFPTDLNGDELFDYVVYSEFNRGASLILSQANDEHIKVDIPDLDNITKFVVVEDFDQDGEDEIVIGEGDFNQSVSILNYESDTFSRKEITTEYRDLNTAAISDLNNDGLIDILFFSRTNFDAQLIYALQGTIGLSDDDGDGFTSDVDCDDSDPDTYPGAEEICDGIDNNCDGSIDDGLTFLSWWLDNDGDGFGLGPMEDRIVDCKQPNGYVQNYDDCDDSNPDIYPGAPEELDNGIDEDCDGKDNSTSTHNLENVTINIFPNPASEILFITQTDGSIDLEVSIFDQSGRTLINTTADEGFIDLQELMNGSYILKLQDTKSQNFIIEPITVVK